MAGALWLIAAIAAARRGEAHTAQERLEQVQRLADGRVATRTCGGPAFGPTNVALHRVSVAAELGDATAALAAANGLDVRRFPPALQGRRVQVGLDLAWAYSCRRQDADAILALLDVERAAPEVTRHKVYARSTISTLLGRARGPAGTRAHARRPQRGCLMTGAPLTLVVCGVPLASRAADVGAALTAAGWSVSLLPSTAGSVWAGPADEGRSRPELVVTCP